MGDLRKTICCTSIYDTSNIHNQNFSQNFLNLRLDDVEKRVQKYIIEKNVSERRLRHATFRRIACKLFYKNEITMVLRMLEARGFLSETLCYVYIKKVLNEKKGRLKKRTHTEVAV